MDDPFPEAPRIKSHCYGCEADLEADLDSENATAERLAALIGSLLGMHKCPSPPRSAVQEVHVLSRDRPSIVACPGCRRPMTNTGGSTPVSYWSCVRCDRGLRITWNPPSIEV